MLTLSSDPNAPPPTPREKKPKKEPADGEAKPANGLTKPVRVSPELGTWLGGVTEISRPQLTAAFWKYVKENGLQVCFKAHLLVAGQSIHTEMAGFPSWYNWITDSTVVATR